MEAHLSEPPPTDAATTALSADRRREIVVSLAGARGLRRLAGAGGGERLIRLLGAEATLWHPGAMREPLTIPGGLIDVAAVDGGSSEGGRFPILRRLSATTVVPRAEGIEGWLWTAASGSAIPTLSDRPDDPPNLALLFVRPLAGEDVERCFRPDWLAALAERSPLGRPSVLGLLAVAERAADAERAFRDFGVLDDVTDREVPPAMRRHLPGDLPANPTFVVREDPRAATSVAPPGMG